jgi:hypothetical protein
VLFRSPQNPKTPSIINFYQNKLLFTDQVIRKKL